MRGSASFGQPLPLGVAGRDLGLALRELVGEPLTGLGQAGEHGGYSFRGEIGLVKGIARDDPVASRDERLRARRIEVPLERGQGRGGGDRLAVGFLPGERPRPRFRDGAFEPLVEFRKLVSGALLFGRDVASVALQGLAPQRHVVRRAAVAFQQRVVTLDRGLQRRHRIAQPVPLVAGVGGGKPCGRELRLGAAERSGGRGLPVAPLVAEAFGLIDGGDQTVVAHARQSGSPNAQGFGLLLVARGLRGLTPERRDVLLDL